MGGIEVSRVPDGPAKGCRPGRRNRSLRLVWEVGRGGQPSPARWRPEPRQKRYPRSGHRRGFRTPGSGHAVSRRCRARSNRPGIPGHADADRGDDVPLARIPAHRQPWSTHASHRWQRTLGRRQHRPRHTPRTASRPQNWRAPTAGQPRINQPVAQTAPTDDSSWWYGSVTRSRPIVRGLPARSCAGGATHVRCGHVGTPDGGKRQNQEDVPGRAAPGTVGRATSLEPEETQAAGSRPRRS